MKSKILIVEDKKSIITALEMLLQPEFEKVLAITNPNNLIATIQQESIDVVLLDMNFKAGINNGNEGIFWLNEMLKYDPSISVIMITAYGDIELAVKAVKEGAFDFILKPWNNQKLISTINAALKLRKSKQTTQSLEKSTKILKQELTSSSQHIIGKSKPMIEIMDMIKKVAVTDANILITGENGTGKEIIAREIHKYSKRNNEIILTVDMGAISETLFESELFGHVKGAFTDAKNERIGKFESANNGTLFLDEIGNLPLTLQAKLLRAVQTRTITKVGSNKPIPVDIRLISATNNNCEEMVKNGTFREDLLYRINTISIEVPPLRDRGADIILLAEYYLNKYVKKYNKPKLTISESAKQKLLKYQWPGNVRELQHSVEKAVILAETNTLSENNFTLTNSKTFKSNDLNDITLEEMEKKLIISNIEKENGNMSSVAKNLGVTRQTLYNKLKKYGI